MTECELDEFLYRHILTLQLQSFFTFDKGSFPAALKVMI